MLPHNTLLQDRYIITRLVSRGNMSVVYEAHDQRLDNLVVIKQVLRGTSRTFKQEAGLLKNMRHPALPKISDYFVDEAGHCLVMEFISGDNLETARYITEFSQNTILIWADQLLDVLEYMHNQQPPVIHCDIKPANLIATKNGQIVLIDFGIAKEAKPEQIMEAHEATAGYTLGYASPEQIRGELIDRRSDLFSLAATIYTLLAGKKPVDALRRLISIENARPDPLLPAHLQNPVVPVLVSEVLRMAMALNPANRFISAQAMRLALRAAGDEGVTEIIVGNVLIPSQGDKPSSISKAKLIETDSPGKGGKPQPKAVTEIRAEKLTVLFLASDPTDVARIRLGQELREIQEKLQLSKRRSRFHLTQKLSVRPSDITQALLDERPKIVHFSGHGLNSGELCFENEMGQAKAIRPDAVASLFELVTDHVDCVLLNTCYSESQARAVAAHIKYVIGVNKDIGDKAAISFAVGFYQALGAGKSIEEAYKFGCVQIRLNDVTESSIPVLLKK